MCAVICEAKRNGLVDSAGALLMQLQANGFRISEPLLVTALKLVDEA